MAKHSKLEPMTDDYEDIIRHGNEGEASVKEDLMDLQEEQSENKKSTDKRTDRDTDKSTVAKKANAKPLENQDEDEGAGKS